jgi:hypothetical protein
MVAEVKRGEQQAARARAAQEARAAEREAAGGYCAGFVKLRQSLWGKGKN